ncbi:MAG: DNA polymerase III subunit delta [Myxococcota bacterium]
MGSSKPSEPPPRVVLLLGEEAALRDAELARLREAVLCGGLADFNEDRFDLARAGTRPAEIVAAARTLPVRAPRRLVRVRGVDDRRAASFIEAELLPYLEDPVATTCLVLEAPKVDRRQAWVKRVAKLGRVVICAAPKRPPDLRAWIEARITSLGKQPGPGVAAELLERVGPQLDLLASEIEKLSLFVGERSRVVPRDVMEVSGELRARALYELTDAIGQRRAGPALAMLAKLIDQGQPPLLLLGTLANHFRRLLRASDCHPLEAKEVERRLGVHPYAARKLTEQVRRFEPERLRSCLAAIRRTDEVLKGALPLSPRLAIERLVLAVCA